MTQASNTWKEVQLGDHVDLLTGYPFKSKWFTQDDNDIRLLRGDNVAQGFLRWNDAKRWSRDEYEAYSSCHLQKGDVILAMDRPWISAGLKYAWIKDSDLPCLLVQRVARLRGTDGLLTDYLRYVIGSHDFTNHVLSITTGVNVPHISGRDIKAFRFKLPPETVQERVVSILSAYDDLIENNTRRIEILEEIARRLYEEWFVYFRYPGHEKQGFKDSDAGKIPKTWECGLLKDYIELSYGKALKKSDRKPGCYPVYGSSGVVGMHHKCLVNGPGIVVGRKGNVGSVFWTEKDFYPIDTAYFVKTSLPLEYVFFNLKRQRFINNDAAVPGLNRNQAYSLPFVKPGDEMLAKFSEQCGPIYNLVRKLREKNINLRAQRDLLLPKLVSGEIDVSDIPMPDDKEVEAA